MKIFECDSCGAVVFFPNDRCISCGHRLGFLPDQLRMVSLDSNGIASQQREAFKSEHSYRLCQNGQNYQVCNWLVSVEDANPLCAACRLNEVIPNLSTAPNHERWRKLELAKRQIIYSILKLGLPTEGISVENRPSLRFCFAADPLNGSPVMTGYDAGRITVNIAEADDDERERRRINLHEPYRTLVGHFRHETGHYYWHRLVANSSYLSRFRELFGDESGDYKMALDKYYQQGPPQDWTSRTITAYANLHPWEDWAETWAHYFHILDTLETAAAFGLSLRPDHVLLKPVSTVGLVRAKRPRISFDELMENWLPLPFALNCLNRGMGLPDLYPFVIPSPAIDKLRFIYEVIGHCGDSNGTGNLSGDVDEMPVESASKFQQA